MTCDLDSFRGLTVDGQMAVLERMLADRADDVKARADRYAQSLSPAPVQPLTFEPAVLSPVAGFSSKARKC